MVSRKILGISPGTRKMGVAVIECASIFDYQMKAFNEKWSAEKPQRILRVIERYIARYQVTDVAIKVPSITKEKEDETVYSLVHQIVNLVNTNKLPLYLYTIADLKLWWCHNYRVDKNELMKAILGKYPDLQVEYKKEISSKVKYYEKLFEAIGVADIALQNCISDT